MRLGWYFHHVEGENNLESLECVECFPLAAFLFKWNKDILKHIIASERLTQRLSLKSLLEEAFWQKKTHPEVTKGYIQEVKVSKPEFGFHTHDLSILFCVWILLPSLTSLRFIPVIIYVICDTFDYSKF